MADRLGYLDNLRQRIPDQPASISIVYTIAGFYLLHQVLLCLDYPILAPMELIWNALVYIIPQRLLLNRSKRQELRAKDMLSQTHAAKSEALRIMLGFRSSSLLQKLPNGGEMLRRLSNVTKLSSDAPPGLGNWDNSCYQNSVLQGLASIQSLRTYLDEVAESNGLPPNSTTAALLETAGKLSSGENDGKHIWTPAKLKNMSSWQQQDAQEYYSKILEELEKEAARMMEVAKPTIGLEAAVQMDKKSSIEPQACQKTLAASVNPLEGLLAQRVACTRCGFSEGLSMIPFNCLTLPLGNNYEYSLDQSLDEYTKLETIDNVDCPKCTLLRAKEQMAAMVSVTPTDGSRDQATVASPQLSDKLTQLPPAVRVQLFERLQAIETALENDDYSEKTLAETCKIAKKAHVSSSKTRQAVIGRGPQSLAIHVNRSLFDELTGVQSKNYAAVRYPILLDMRRWTFSAETEGDGKGSKSVSQDSMLGKIVNDNYMDIYRLKAVITHYGRHENGHYIAYRQHPTTTTLEVPLTARPDTDPGDAEHEMRGHDSQWWRLSDEDVSRVSEAETLAQGGVFMLFYERELWPQESTIEVSQPMQEAEPIVADPQKPLPEDAHLIGSADTELPDVAPTHLEVASAIAPPLDSILPPQPASMGPVPVESVPARPGPAAAVPASAELLSDSELTTEDESEVEKPEPPRAVQPLPRRRSPPTMRTARTDSPGSAEGFAAAFRPMAAT